MITLSAAQKTIILTQEEFDALFAHQEQIPADVREIMRVKLRQLLIIIALVVIVGIVV